MDKSSDPNGDNAEAADRERIRNHGFWMGIATLIVGLIDVLLGWLLR